MTITVSIEELKDYEDRCVKWGVQRGQEIERTITTHHSDPFSQTRKPNVEALKKWDAEHPFPKVLPNV